MQDARYKVQEKLIGFLILRAIEQQDIFNQKTIKSSIRICWKQQSLHRLFVKIYNNRFANLFNLKSI